MCNLMWIVASDDKALFFGTLIVYVYVELCMCLKLSMLLCVCGVDMYFFEYLVLDQRGFPALPLAIVDM